MFHTCTISQNMYFILSGLKLTSKIKNNVLIVVILHCKTLLLLLRWDTGKVRDRLSSISKF